MHYLKAILLKTIDTILLELQSIENLTKKQQAIIDYMKENPSDNMKNIAQKLDIELETLATHLRKICERLKIFHAEKSGNQSRGFRAVQEYVKSLN